MARNLTAMVDMDDAATRTLRDLSRAISVADKDTLKALKTRVLTEIEQPLARKGVRAMSAAGKYPEVASTIKAGRGGRRNALASIYLGRGSGRPAVLAFGTEFGGQKPRKVAYITRSRTGASRYIVRRRTTMQFWPHNGQRGHILIPILRRDTPDTVRKTIDIVMDELKKMPAAREVRV